MSESTTQLINRWIKGDQSAFDELYRQIEPELRKIARNRLDRGITMQTTAYVNELYLRLSTYGKELESKEDLYRLCAEIMRRLAIENFRKRSAKKRGGGKLAEPLDEVANEVANRVYSEANQNEQLLLALDMALDELAEADPERAQLLKMHWFGGLSYEEIANLKGLTPDQIRGRLRVALSWLRAELQKAKDDLPD